MVLLNQQLGDFLGPIRVRRDLGDNRIGHAIVVAVVLDHKGWTNGCVGISWRKVDNDNFTTPKSRLVHR